MVPINIEVVGENCKDCVNIEIETTRTVDATETELCFRNTLRCKHYETKEGTEC